jgi:hypothetical protein
MVHWAKLGRILEEISSRFFSDDLGSLSFTDPKSLFTMKAFEKQLDQWGREASGKFESRKLSSLNHTPPVLTAQPS